MTGQLISLSLIMNETVAQFLVWIGVNIGIIASIHLSFVKISVGRLAENSIWRKFLNFRQDDNTGQWYFQIKPDKMTNFQRSYNYLQILMHAIILFAYGNWTSRLNLLNPEAKWQQLWYLIPALLSGPIFGFFGEIRGMQFSISPSSLRHMTIQAKIALALAILAILSLFGYQIYLAHLASILQYYLPAILIIPCLYLVLYWFYLKEAKLDSHMESILPIKTKSYQPIAYWHIHHWFIGFYFSLILWFPDPLTTTASLIFYGVFLQGSIAFGSSPIIVGQGSPITDVVWTSGLFDESTNGSM